MLIGIAGGIGSGKSVVSRILYVMGYPVYDCDSRAKAIMDADPAIHRSLREQIHELAVVEGIVDRRLISEIVFSDSQALARLNSIVHSAVFRDLEHWCRAQSASKLFVESAIFVSSGLIDRVDDVWEVTAPVELRIERVVKRNGISPEQVAARIESQRAEQLNSFDCKHIVNDGVAALLPQIHNLLREE